MQLKKKTKRLKRLISTRKRTRIIVVFLVSIWVLGSLFFNNEFSYSVLKYEYSNKLDKNVILYKNHKISDEFKSKDDNLGIIFIKFNEFIKPDYKGEDVLQFRIKEKGSKDWYYLNNYKSGLLKDSLEFPFGFPIIKDSKEKTYIFEIESLFGNKSNTVSIKGFKKYLGSGHKYNKSEILANNRSLFNYEIKKVINSFTNINFLLSSIIFALPLLFYLLWLFFGKKIKSNTNSALYIMFIIFLFNIFIIEEVFFGIYLGLLIGWIIAIKVYKLESSVSYLFGVVTVLTGTFLIYFNLEKYAIKLNIWSYSFLVIGTIQFFIETKYNIKNLNNYKKFIKRFYG